ncbi:MAG: hypothetical protein IJ583_06205 [Firmicutes bacterium]|nr:hypothetical protein [Bacillota bacterium]
MKQLKKILSAMLAGVMTFSSAVFSESIFAADVLSAGGWNETIYASWTDSVPSEATVTYKNVDTQEEVTLTGEDKKYLQRSVDGTARVDIPGVKAGTYNIKITASNGNEYSKDGIVVPEQDRSGYAHFNNNDGVGAYKDDGSLKDNAIVLYVTDSNKNTVTLSYGGKSIVGIGNILNSRGASSEATTKNTNDGILKTLAENNIPLVVRIVGKVEAGDSNTKGGTNPMGNAAPVPSESINGLTAYSSKDYGGSVEDNGMMARMTDAKNVTIEGIGYDATIDGWGVHFIASTAGAAAELGQSFEVKNIRFANYPEDAIGMEGQQANGKLTAPVKYCWIHNNTFESGYCSNPTESDKSEGDGSCDFKRGTNYTLAYNRFMNCHKTNLIGASDDNLQYDITFHHNYWSDCKARGPLARKANIHLYNNYVLAQTDYAENARASAFLFSEYCYFENCKGALSPAGGKIASYNDVFVSCLNSSEDTCKITDRSQAVYAENAKGNFVIDPSLGYIANGNYRLDTNAADAKAKCMAYSGVMKKDIITPESIDVSIIPAELYNAAIDAPVNVPYSVDYAGAGIKNIEANTMTVVDNIVYKPGKKYSSGNAMTICQAGIVFFLNKTAKVTMSGVSGTAVPVLYSEDGEAIINTSGEKVLSPGVYVVQSSIYDVGTGKYKEAKINSLSFETVSEGETVTMTSRETTEATTSEKVTSEKVSESTTEAKEEQSESTTADPNGYASYGTYVMGSAPTVTGDYYVKAKSVIVGNIDFYLRDLSGTEASFRAEDGKGISFRTNSKAKLSLTVSNRAALLVDVNKGTTYNYPKGATTVIEIPAGTYQIVGSDEGNNTKISVMVLTKSEDTKTVQNASSEEFFTIGKPIDLSTGQEAETIVKGEFLAFPVNVNSSTGSINNVKFTLKYDNSILQPGINENDVDAQVIDKLSGLGELRNSNSVYVFSDKAAKTKAPESTTANSIYGENEVMYQTQYSENYSLSQNEPEFYVLFTVENTLSKLNQELFTIDGANSSINTDAAVELINPDVKQEKINECAAALMICIDTEGYEDYIQALNVKIGDKESVKAKKYYTDDDTIYKFPVRIFSDKTSAAVKISADISSDKDGKENNANKELYSNTIDLGSPEGYTEILIKMAELK